MDTLLALVSFSRRLLQNWASPRALSPPALRVSVPPPHLSFGHRSRGRGLPEAVSLFVWSTLLIGAFGCSLAPEGSTASFRVESLSGAPLDDVSPTFRLRVEGVGGLSTGDFLLIEGTIGSTTQSRLRAGELTASVEKRRRALAVWQQDDAIVAAAAEVLEPGSYSLVARFAGTLAEVTVTEDAPDIFWRLASADPSLGSEVAYCALPEQLEELGVEKTQAPVHESGQGVAVKSESALEPLEGVQLGLGPGWLSSHCLRVEVRKEWVHDGVFVPPLVGQGRLLDPAPIAVFVTSERHRDDAGEWGPVTSGANGAKVGSGAEAEGAPRILSEGECGTLWGGALCLEGASLRWDTGDSVVREGVLSLHSEDQLRALRFVREGAVPLRLGPLPPDARIELRAAALLDGSSELELGSFELHTGSPRPHFVLTEVMADPEGPEPQSEWVEIVNAGTASGSVAGFSIADEGGSTPLPDFTLEPGSYGLIVRADFVVDSQLVPAPDAVPLVVPSIGDNGLRNSGERVELRGPDGHVQSAVPRGAPGAGRSWARRSLWAHDGPSSFAGHAEPGGSPGAPNEF